MRYTFKQIVDNQKKFKNDILDFLGEEKKTCEDDIKKLEESVVDLKVKDKVLELKKKIKSIKKKDYEKLLFSSRNRSEKYYAWWDEKQEQTIIFQY
jgi:hypothetical protein